MKGRKEQKKKTLLNQHDSPQRQMLHALSVAHLFSADQTCILEATHRQTHSQKSKASQFPRENVIVIIAQSLISKPLWHFIH